MLKPDSPESSSRRTIDWWRPSLLPNSTMSTMEEGVIGFNEGEMFVMPKEVRHYPGRR